MSWRREDGTYRCDRCNRDVGNAGVHLVAKVVDLDENGNQVNLDFCREPSRGAPRGCAAHVFSPANLAAYRKVKP